MSQVEAQSQVKFRLIMCRETTMDTTTISRCSRIGIFRPSKLFKSFRASLTDYLTLQALSQRVWLNLQCLTTLSVEKSPKLFLIEFNKYFLKVLKLLFLRMRILLTYSTFQIAFLKMSKGIISVVLRRGLSLYFKKLMNQRLLTPLGTRC